jgi:hypothetical protein
MQPDIPESHFDLAAVQAMQNKGTQALASLGDALRQSAARLQREPTALNLYSNALTDGRFAARPIGRTAAEFFAFLSPRAAGRKVGRSFLFCGWRKRWFRRTVFTTKRGSLPDASTFLRTLLTRPV